MGRALQFTVVQPLRRLGFCHATGFIPVVRRLLHYSDSNHRMKSSAKAVEPLGQAQWRWKYAGYFTYKNSFDVIGTWQRSVRACWDSVRPEGIRSRWD